MPRIDRVVVSCEHGGNRAPSAYRELFASCARLLASHRGYDPGTLELSRRIARAIRCPIVESQITRLFVDLNRSATNPAVFSSITRRLSRDERHSILTQYHEPHRRQVERVLKRALDGGGRVLHLCVHSFTPVLNGKVRDADVGLLYDPRRAAERALAAAWKKTLKAAAPSLHVRMNYPYLGRSDGLATSLRSRLGRRYLGIELEVNQRWVRRGSTVWLKLQTAVIRSLQACLD